MGLRAHIAAVESISFETVREMFDLLDACYHNVTREQFQRDLFEKDWVIIIKDSTSLSLKGFSTLKVFLHDFQGKTCRVAFSGDTIIAPSCWGSLRLPMAFGALMLSILNERPDLPLYWMLITKGIRTYRVLPVFFKEFYPRYDNDTPVQMCQLMHALGYRKYPRKYTDSGIIKAPETGQYLRRELSGENSVQDRLDHHVRYFLNKNPGHVNGDELLCLAEFSLDNLCPYIIRQLQKAEKLEIVRNSKTFSKTI
ncbi:MAG: hypothetical protein K8S27_15745 [Candidatus Omnitrophica bacterium]|nr:hypothetical protein [Candidatus Omnitrophota bacterium]